MNFLKVFGLVGLARAAGVLRGPWGGLLAVRVDSGRVAGFWEVVSAAGAVASAVGTFIAAGITWAVFKVAQSLKSSLINTEAEFLSTLVTQDCRAAFSALRNCYYHFCVLRSINSQDDDFGLARRRMAARAIARHAEQLDLVFCRTSWDKLHLLPNGLKESVLAVFECAPRLRTLLSTDADIDYPKLTSKAKVEFESRMGELAILLMTVLKLTVESPEMTQLKAAVSQAHWMNAPGRLETEVIQKGEGM